MCHGKGRISQQRPQFLDYSENILFQALVKHFLNSRDAKKHQFTQFTHSVCSHCWPALTKQPWSDHGGGYGSDDRSSSQTFLDPPFPRKNGRSKKIGQNKPKNDSLCSKQVCFWENLSTTAGYTNRDDFWNSKKKSENYLKQRDFRICGFLHFFAGFCGFSP